MSCGILEQTLDVFGIAGQPGQGRPLRTSGGGDALRDACEQLARIGRTLAINPGSEYSEGVLRGAIITLSRKKGVRGYQLVAG